MAAPPFRLAEPILLWPLNDTISALMTHIPHPAIAKIWSDRGRPKILMSPGVAAITTGYAVAQHVGQAGENLVIGTCFGEIPPFAEANKGYSCASRGGCVG